MKPRVCRVRIHGTRLVRFEDIPTGTVVCDLDGFWGVVVRAGSGGIFSGDGLDRWDAPPIKLERGDLLQMPYPKKSAKPLPEPLRARVT